MTSQTANYDEPWKEALSEYFEPFLYFFFPEVHQLIDWTKIPESLEKELKRITASARTKKRFAEKISLRGCIFITIVPLICIRNQLSVSLY
jgi:hypothetical protein